MPDAAAPLNVLWVEYGVAFGGAVISMSELVNSFTGRGLVHATVLSALPREIIAPLFNHAVPVSFPRPVNYVLRDRVMLALSRSRLPSFMQILGSKVYALLDELAAGWNTVRLYRIIKKNNIQIVHVNNSIERDAIYAADWAGRPCVVHCRGLADDRYRFLIRSKAFARTVKKVIAISGAVADSLREQGVPEDKIAVIFNPIQWAKYDTARGEREVVRARWHITPEDVVVSIFGRITNWKGQYEFLQAVGSIIASCPRMKVMIVGDSSDDVHGYSKVVEEFAQRGALAGRVIFTGYQKEVAHYYWAADIVVHNSRIPEPFGRVVTEAMACGRAVIAMKEGGPIDIIEHGHDGILALPRDCDDLARSIEALYESAGERARLGANARQSVLRKFESEVISRGVLAIYKDALRPAATGA
jgi:glycosyltransferase involved in cell wall biosynthesis